MPEQEPPKAQISRNPFKSMAMTLVGIFCVLYLINPGAGVIELIPDNIPFFGNLDEAAVVLILVRVLAYFGIDITGVLRKYSPMRNVTPSKNPDSKP